ncbi:MAG: metallophosphoesterase [Paracoccaceae bacterium]
MPGIAPAEPLCLVGDLHGRSDLLKRFLSLRDHHFPGHRIVFLGDAVDRGHDSAGVLDLLRAQQAREPSTLCLAGNHEAMLLQFMDDPAGDQGRRWLAHGGLDTLASFGLRGVPQDGAAREAARDALRAAMGAVTEDWLRNLPRFWQSGNLVAVHAALDPALPPEAQDEQPMLWGHRDFGRKPRPDGLWVAHGHVIVEKAFARQGRIALDTGAYATGMLSYALIDPSLPETERVTLAAVP